MHHWLSGGIDAPARLKCGGEKFPSVNASVPQFRPIGLHLLDALVSLVLNYY